MKKIYIKYLPLFVAFSLIFIIFLSLSRHVEAQYGYSVQCEFAHNLQVGSVGEDVRCLQRFLNSQGFIISSYGFGAPGNESTHFGQLTASAVSRWQTTNNIQVNGIWGPSSISVYYRLVGLSPQSSQSNYYPSNLNYNQNYNYPYTPTNQDSEIRSIIENLRELFDEFFDEIDNASQSEIDRSQDSITDATSELLDAFVSFVSRDSNEAVNRALEAENLLEDAVDEIGGSRSNNNDDRDDARDAIEDAEDRIDFAEDEIRDARNNGQSVSRSERLLDDARDSLRDAEDAFDDNDYDEAIDFAEEAEDLADEAADAL